jgi:hypothetical protein
MFGLRQQYIRSRWSHHHLPSSGNHHDGHASAATREAG